MRKERKSERKRSIPPNFLQVIHGMKSVERITRIVIVALLLILPAYDAFSESINRPPADNILVLTESAIGQEKHGWQPAILFYSDNDLDAYANYDTLYPPSPFLAVYEKNGNFNAIIYLAYKDGNERKTIIQKLKDYVAEKHRDGFETMKKSILSQTILSPQQKEKEIGALRKKVSTALPDYFSGKACGAKIDDLKYIVMDISYFSHKRSFAVNKILYNAKATSTAKRWIKDHYGINPDGYELIVADQCAKCDKSLIGIGTDNRSALMGYPLSKEVIEALIQKMNSVKRGSPNPNNPGEKRQ